MSYPNQPQPGFPGALQQQPGFPGAPHQQPGFPGEPYQQPGYPGEPYQQPGYPPGPAPPGVFPQVHPSLPGQQPPYPNSGTLPEPGPTAPSLDQMNKVKGYEGISFDESIIQPPTAPGWQDQPQPERTQITSLPRLNDDEVQDAVLKYSSEHCCYGSGVAKNMSISDVDRKSVFHYILETFGEKRESAWRFEPYNGQAIDGPMNGPAPSPWDIPVQPNNYFVTSKIKMEVPHTAYVKPCHTCVGNGRVKCDSCNGWGQSNCTWCSGSGKRMNEPCSSCSSSGRTRCTWCSGTGQKECKTCRGKSQLKGFVELIVTFNNHYEDYISECSTLPKDEIRKANGQNVFNEEQFRVWPISHSGDPGVDGASRDLVNKHSTQFTNERIIKQRHRLTIVPVARVNYKYKNKNDEFYVYGFENKVYFEKYPQNCCWGCSIS